jgi:Xaa-Pro aminopeptidase
MDSNFSSDFFARNRQKLRQKLGDNTPIVMAGNGVMQRSGDEPSQFYQESNFWYLTGLNGIDLTLVMTERETYVIVPSLSFVREAFDGAHDTKEYASRSGITTFLTEREGWSRLKDELRGAAKVATLGSPPTHMKFHGVYTLPYRRRLIAKLKRMQAGIEVQDIRPEMASMRSIKQPEELQALQQAIDVTTETLVEITRSDILTKAEHEYQLEAALSYGFRYRGAAGHGFEPIVGAGKHSTTLHHMENNGRITMDDLIVLDVGAGVEHYSADITRTVSKTPITGRKADVWKAVAAAQDYALSLIKPGASFREYEIAVETFVGKELRKLGVVDDLERTSIRHYFPHATTHFLGLDTHDAGDYRHEMQPGMVITCEPGIYLPEEQIGVRLEDDILITETGHKVLSDACPRKLTPVE